MRDFELVCDSTCDLPLELLAEMDVTVVPLTVIFGEETFLDQVEITSEQFYDRMAAAAELPRSSQPSPEAFVKTYRGLVEKGAKRILSLHIAEALSGTVNSARIAAEEVDADIVAYDSKTVAMTTGMMVREAVAMRDAGETLEATVDHLNRIRPSLQLLVVPDTLDNLVKNGRLSAVAGLATSLLDIKVQIGYDDEGNLVAEHKAKGTRHALRYVVRSIESRQPRGTKLLITMLTVRNQAGCRRLLDMIEEDGYPVELLGTYNAGPVVAAHGGMGLIAMGYMPAKLAYHAPDQG